MRKLSFVPGTNEAEFYFRNEAGIVFRISNNSIKPDATDIESLPGICFDITIQGVMDNALLLFNQIDAEINQAIENFEGCS